MLHSMASHGYIDPSTTQLKLEHDVTPRDASSYEPSANQFAQKSFGFKGYPHGQFMSPRQPVRDHRREEFLEQQTNFGKTQHFSREKPKIYENHYGVQYSDGVPVSNQEPRKISNPLNSKTSAELRKYQQMCKEAEEDISKYKLEKMKKMKETQMEKKADLAMLENYNPWGKGGGGAPLPSMDMNKRKLFTEEDLARQEKLSPRDMTSSRSEGFYDKFGRPGHGAPMVTSSGKLISNVRGDAAIRFGQNAPNKNRPPIDPIRYHADGVTANDLKSIYDKQIKDNALMNEEARIKERQQEVDMLKYDPFGKPGAGAPNQNREKRRRTHSDEGLRDSYDPWGKGIGVARRDEFGNVQRHANTKDKDHGIVTAADSNAMGDASIDMGKAWAGAPKKTDSGKVNARFQNTMNFDLLGDAKITELSPSKRGEVYDPWGKAGAGAPKKDQNGNVQTTVFGKLRHEALSGDSQKKKLAAQQYLNELQHEMAEQKQIREEDQRYQKQPIGELASVIKDYQVGRPRRDQYTGQLLNQHLPSSDVTKEKTDTRPQKTEHSRDYHNDLEREAQRRHVDRQLDKLKELQMAEQHYKANDSFWGRPGAGAPRGVNKKMNLDEALHHYSKTEPSYQKVSENGKVETSPRQNYIRSTIPSTHSNHFENEIDIQRRLPKRDYKISAPYATI